MERGCQGVCWGGGGESYHSHRREHLVGEPLLELRGGKRPLLLAVRIDIEPEGGLYKGTRGAPWGCVGVGGVGAGGRRVGHLRRSCRVRAAVAAAAATWRARVKRGGSLPRG